MGKIPKQKYTFDEQVVHLKILNKRNKLVAFVGAGMSVGCGLPDWNQLKNGLKIELQKKNCILQIREQNIEDLARKEFGKNFNNIVANVLYNNEITISEDMIWLAQSGISRFISFNFDDLFEEVLKTEMIDHKIILNGERFNMNYKGALVFHPHGFLERFDSNDGYKNSNIILSKTDYDNLYNDHFCITNLIQLSMLLNYSVLFIGMSLNDHNITRLLKTSWEIGVRHWHTAIMRLRPTKRENGQILKKFRKMGVEPDFPHP